MKQLERILFAQGGECFFCKQQLPKEKASVEHLVALANGGRNDEDNCVVCCKQLNSLLGSKSIKAKILVVLNQRGAFVCPAESEHAFADQPIPVQPKAPQPQPLATRPQAKKAPRYVFTLAEVKQPKKPASANAPAAYAGAASGAKARPAAAPVAAKRPKAQPLPRAKDANFNLVLSNLKQRGTSRPRTLKTLTTTVSALLPKSFAKSELASLLQQLQSTGKVVVSEGKVTYAL